jgi:hypothetical protein
MTPAEAREQTVAHISRVNDFLSMFCSGLESRGKKHDASKLDEPEATIFEENTPKLCGMTYGSEEYMKTLECMRPALDHHYAENRHHPEHFENGVDEMDLLDLVEMFCDWRAAVERHETGDIFNSIKFNTKRFNLSPQLVSILMNTASRLERGEW